MRTIRRRRAGGAARKLEENSGRPADGRGETDQCGADENHGDFVAKAVRRDPDLLNRNRTARVDRRSGCRGESERRRNSDAADERE
jgi:hypothetical protein